MKKKKQFIRPEILLELNLQGDKPILEGSVVDHGSGGRESRLLWRNIQSSMGVGK